jgi:DNA-binding NarL/FixJ family response regulator
MKIKKTVDLVIVDDSRIDIRIMSEWLKEFPNFLIQARYTSAKEFLLNVPKCQHTDVFLIDYYMPLYSGLEVIAHLPQEMRLKCILLSNGFPAKISTLVKSGIRGFTRKEKSQFMLTLKIAAQEKKYFDIDHLNKFETLTGAVLNDENWLPLEFTPKEILLINYLSCGLTYKEISNAIGILSERSIETYIQTLKLKLGLKSVAQIVKYACVHGLIYMFDDI